MWVRSSNCIVKLTRVRNYVSVRLLVYRQGLFLSLDINFYHIFIARENIVRTKLSVCNVLCEAFKIARKITAYLFLEANSELDIALEGHRE